MSEDKTIRKIEGWLNIQGGKPKKKKKKLTLEHLDMLAKVQGKKRLIFENKGLNKTRKENKCKK